MRRKAAKRRIGQTISTVVRLKKVKKVKIESPVQHETSSDHISEAQDLAIC